jgi:hypothetical protein
VMGDFANKQGWFGQNEFGDETFHYPSVGLMAVSAAREFLSNPLAPPANAIQAGLSAGEFGESRISTSVSGAQILSNPLIEFASGERDETLGSARSLLAPGLSPVATFGLPFLQSLLPPEWRKPFQQITKGNFPIGSSEGDELWSTMPASFRALVDLLTPESLTKSQRRFAQYTATSMEVLVQSGQADLTSEEGLQDLEERSQAMGETLAWVRLIDTLFNPESVRYHSEILVDTAGTGLDQWVNAAALGKVHRELEEMTGDPEVAALMMEQQFGISRTQLGALDIPKTATVIRRPVSFAGYVFWENNADFVEDYQFIAGFFAPSEDKDFYSQAYTNSLNEGDAKPRNAFEQTAYVSNSVATLTWNHELAESEARREQFRASHPVHEWDLGEATEDAYMRQVALNLEAAYPHWSRAITGERAKFTPGPERPRIGDFLRNVEAMITVDESGTATPDPKAVALNPGMAYFLADFMEIRSYFERVSLQRGLTAGGWSGSQSAWAVGMKNDGVAQLKSHIAIAKRQGEETEGMTSFLNYVVIPYFSGVDEQGPVIYDAFQRPVATPDRIGEEVIPVG